MKNFSFGSYMNNGNKINSLMFEFGSLKIWFSYKTIVAIQDGSDERIVRENDWSNTTGRHLNAIDFGDKKSRVSGEVFEEAVENILKKHNLTFN